MGRCELVYLLRFWKIKAGPRVLKTEAPRMTPARMTRGPSDFKQVGRENRAGGARARARRSVLTLQRRAVAPSGKSFAQEPRCVYYCSTCP
jgi:hypothetical protein